MAGRRRGRRAGRRQREKPQQRRTGRKEPRRRKGRKKQRQRDSKPAERQRAKKLPRRQMGSSNLRKVRPRGCACKCRPIDTTQFDCNCDTLVAGRLLQHLHLQHLHRRYCRQKRLPRDAQMRPLLQRHPWIDLLCRSVRRRHLHLCLHRLCPPGLGLISHARTGSCLQICRFPFERSDRIVASPLRHLHHLCLRHLCPIRDHQSPFQCESSGRLESIVFSFIKRC